MTVPWTQVPLGAITTAQYGLSVAASDDGNVPILGMKHLQDGRIVFSDLVRVSLSKEETATYRVHAGDILFNRTNSCDLVGKAAIIEAETQGPIVFASYLVRLKVDAARALPHYVNYFLNSPGSEKKLKDMATPGVSQFNINPTQLRKHFQILLPSLTEQRAIVGVLSTWDRGIRQLSDLIAAKLRFKQGLMQQLLTGKRRFPEFRDEWEHIPIGRLVTGRKELRTPSEECPLYSLTIEDGVTPKSERYDRQALVRDKNSKTYKVVKPSDIVFNPSNLRWGAIGISRESHTVVVSPIYEVIYPVDYTKVNKEFLFQALSSPHQIARFATMCEGTLVERMAVKLPTFLACHIPFPPTVREQQRIAEALRTCDSEITIYRRQLDALKTQKKGLMQKLLTGQVRVKT